MSTGAPSSSHESSVRLHRSLRIEPPAKDDALATTAFSAFDLAIYSGVESQALISAVASRVGVSSNCFFFTASSDRNGMVIPLTAALPDGMVLVLQYTEGRPLEPITFPATPGNQTTPPRTPSPAKPLSQLPATATAITRADVNYGAESAGMKESLLQSAEGSQPRTSRALSDGSGPISMQQPRRNTQDDVESVSSVNSMRRSSLMRWGSFAVNSRQQERDVEMVSAIERFSRLTTDLANERTLLAWIRTCLAAIRTVFAYLSITGNGTYWTINIIGSEMAMALFVLMLAGTGYLRYNKVKAAISMRVTPLVYGRISLRYMYVVLIFASLAVVPSIFARHIEKAR